MFFLKYAPTALGAIFAADSVPSMDSLFESIIAKGGVGAIAGFLIWWLTKVLSQKLDDLGKRIDAGTDATTKLGEHVNKLGDSIKYMNGKNYTA